MKELVRFSLYRRFNNRATKIFNVIVCIVVLCACFADKIMEVIDPTMFEPKTVYVYDANKELLQFLNESSNTSYVFKKGKGKISAYVEKGEYVLKEKDKTYILYSKYECDETILLNFTMYLNTYRKDKMLEECEDVELLLAYNEDIVIENKVLEKQVNLTKEKSNLIFMLVTGVYFMMLGFISTVASEVVNEKATKTLELLLTSVPAKIHFYAKVLVGWLVIMIQGMLSLSYIAVGLYIRRLYDQGSGLIAFVKKFGLLNSESNTFYTLLKELNLTTVFYQKLIVAILFLMLGVLFIQLVMVIVSSFVSSVEEAGNIQAPFYLLLLIIYYFVIAINNPYDLTEGIGYYMSYMPFINMLLMPCRLLISEVPIFEIVVSLSASIFAIICILYIGIPLYEKGVLDYSCKRVVLKGKGFNIINKIKERCEIYVEKIKIKK